MKAVVLNPRQKSSLKLADLPLPRYQADEVLVKTVTVGIDATDLEISSGIYGEGPDSQDYLVAGHEAVGQVAEIGDKATGIQEGDFVVPVVRASCGNCIPCAKNEPDMCQTNQFTERGIKGANGFLSDFFTEKAVNLVKLPADIVAFGSLVEPLSVAEKAIEHAFKIQERFHWAPARMLVLGAGSLGILTTLALRSKGFETFAYDIEDEASLKASAVRELEATYVDGNKVPIDKFNEKFAPPDLVIEATGNSQIAINAISLLNKNGIACLLGVTSGGRKNEICTDCLNDQLVMNNNVVFGSVSSNKRHFNKAIETLERSLSKWPTALEMIITNRFGLNDYGKAYQKDSAIKNVIDLFD